MVLTGLVFMLRFENTGGLMVSTDGLDWTSYVLTGGDGLASIDWTGERFVAVSADQEVLTSSDGYRWTLGQMPADSQNVAEFDGKFFVSTGKRVLAMSNDGEVWTVDVTLGKAGPMVAGSDRLCMIVEGRLARVTLDGETWEEVRLPPNRGFAGPFLAGGEFLLTDRSGGIWKSADGLNWRLEVVGVMDAVVWDGMRYFGHSGINTVVSEDGENWTLLENDRLSGFVGQGSLSPGLLSAKVNDMIAVDGGVVAVGERGRVFSWVDGLGWIRTTNFRDTRSQTNLKAIAQSDFALVAVGEREIWRSRRFRESFDLIELEGAPFLNDVAWNGSLFVTVGGGKLYSSPDGFTWTLAHDWQAANLRSIAWTGSEWLIGGTLPNDDGVSAGMVATSTDLVTWSTWEGLARVTYEAVESFEGRHVATALDGTMLVSSETGWRVENPGLVGEIVSVINSPAGLKAFNDGGMGSTRSETGEWIPGVRRVRLPAIGKVVADGEALLVLGRFGGLGFSRDGENWRATENVPDFDNAVFFEDQFHAVAGSTVFASADGETWQPYSLIEDSSLQTIEVFQERLFVGGNRNGGRAVWEWSGDGWNLRYSVEAANQRDFRLSSSPRLMVGSENAISINEPSGSHVTSNGVDWEKLSMLEVADGDFSKVIHTAHGFIVVGTDRILRSEDGVNWETVLRSPGRPFHQAIDQDGLLVAVGSVIATSVDGANWEVHTPRLATAATLLDVAWNGEQFLAVGPQSQATSPDGVEWSISESRYSLAKVVWHGGEWLGVSLSGMILSSPNGEDWSYQPFHDEAPGVAFFNGKYFTNSVGGVLQSDDGFRWDEMGNLENGSRLSGSGRFEEVNGRLFYFEQTVPSAVLGADGATWTSFFQFPLQTLAWDGQRYLATVKIGQDPLIVASLTEGAAPLALPSTNGPETSNDSIWTGDRLIVVGDNGAIKSSSDGLEWETLELGIDDHLMKIEQSGDRIVIMTAGGRLWTLEEEIAAPDGFRIHNFLALRQERMTEWWRNLSSR